MFKATSWLPSKEPVSEIYLLQEEKHLHSQASSILKASTTASAWPEAVPLFGNLRTPPIQAHLLLLAGFSKGTDTQRVTVLCVASLELTI